jgi:hypothetical protein
MTLIQELDKIESPPSEAARLPLPGSAGFAG